MGTVGCYTAGGGVVGGAIGVTLSVVADRLGVLWYATLPWRAGGGVLGALSEGCIAGSRGRLRGIIGGYTAGSRQQRCQ